MSRTGDRLLFDQTFDNDGEIKLIRDQLFPSVKVRHLGRLVIVAAVGVT